ncbi:hypothetical protein KUTeg_000750 [Tegillarca granosa]|uniref:Peroxidase n=1 Tax=Tegillarca granosa TaxID=220873 RepID=A0ABQ9FYI3_TEGGR|nr:hypothetical protein KUTeg_000750 [Tegillarca granosa]
MSLKQMKKNRVLLREWRRTIMKDCPIKYPKCNSYSRYRTADGSCNNLRNPALGAALTPQRRLIEAQHHDGRFFKVTTIVYVYSAGFNSPKMLGVDGHKLPSPRMISNIIHKTSVSYYDNIRTMIVFHYGQLVEHDVILTPTFRGHQDAEMECCDADPRFTAKRAACFPIHIPDRDARFNISCMNFVRVIPSVYPYCPMRASCLKPQTRTPINLQTSYFDASMVYGSSLQEQRKIRLGIRVRYFNFKSNLKRTDKQDHRNPHFILR